MIDKLIIMLSCMLHNKECCIDLLEVNDVPTAPQNYTLPLLEQHGN